jgi:anaerobic ribonucleoside-triphosphate reductase activating protein
MVRVAGVKHDSIVDGPGLRFVVFAQGCPLGCPECHNPAALDPNGGTEVLPSDLIHEMQRNPLISGLTLTGGEPFFQAAALVPIAKAALESGLSVWIYSGYTFEELLQSGNPDWLTLLGHADVLVDGPFIEAQKSLRIKFRGSKNQRILNVPLSLAAGAAVEVTALAVR